MKKTMAIAGTVSILLLGSLFLALNSQAQTVNMGRTYVSSQNVRYANEAGTGTILNKLAKLTGAPSTAILTATTDTSGIIGIVVAGAGTTGSADIAFKGKALCVFDSATTAGHYVTNDTSTAGDCMDAGATYPTSGQVIGVVNSTNGGAGTYEVDLTLGQPQAGGGGSGGPPFLVLMNDPTSASASWQDYTIFGRMAGAELFNTPASFKVTFRFTAGSPVIGAMKILRTNADSLTVLDSTTVMIGGIANPTLIIPTLVTTDAIALALDRTYDYWFALYFTNDPANAGGLSLASSGGSIQHRTGHVSGDHTADATIPSLAYTYAPILIIGIVP
jgi:hypothetical protein